MTKRKKQFASVCGLSEAGVDSFLVEAEQRDLGTTRYPWPDGFRDEIKAAIEGMTYMPMVRQKINQMVVAKLGPGLFGRGPFEQHEVGA